MVTGTRGGDLNSIEPNLNLSSTNGANGIATVWVNRPAAKRARIKPGYGPAVRIGIGTVSSITNGSVTLRPHLFAGDGQEAVPHRARDDDVRLALVAAGNQRYAIEVAGSY